MNQSDQHNKKRNPIAANSAIIVMSGGGSGGHIMPLLSVARELKRKNPAFHLVYIGERGGSLGHVVEDSRLFDECHYIFAGKLRRYHTDSLFRKLTDLKTQLLNLRDGIKLTFGLFQAFFLLRRLRPAVVFLKGGFVCVPVSMGAARSGARIVTHDSDALPGLANRIAARYAVLHATGMPTQYYSYPEASMRYVGLPVDSRFRVYSAAEQRLLKEKYGIPTDGEVVVVTGGSLGALRLNHWAAEALQNVMKRRPNLYVFIVTGKGKRQSVEARITDENVAGRVNIEEFTTELFHMAAIADVVVARAGGSTLAELAAQKKACIIVPNPDLTGGHQLKNAQVFKDANAVVEVSETDLLRGVESLEAAVEGLLDDRDKRDALGNALASVYPDFPADQALAEIIIEQAMNSDGVRR